MTIEHFKFEREFQHYSFSTAVTKSFGLKYIALLNYEVLKPIRAQTYFKVRGKNSTYFFLRNVNSFLIVLFSNRFFVGQLMDVGMSVKHW
jgi:hypothetical protein